MCFNLLQLTSVGVLEVEYLISKHSQLDDLLGRVLSFDILKLALDQIRMELLAHSFIDLVGRSTKAEPEGDVWFLVH